jgi:uncharacterized protein involved in type VI secretion and phage assembly
MIMPSAQARVGATQDRFYGKYRGVVIDNVDPEGRGRLQVSVPEVRGPNVVEWAMPSSPYAGDGVGFFALPPVKANVWVEYEGGNMRVPIWSGCFWERGQIDAADAVPDVMFLKTKAATLRIDSASGEIKIEIQGASITLTASEIKIEASQITNSASGAKTQLTAAGFDALQGALKVM